ncbi:MAG: LysR family transcriptional regulator [Sphingobium sp.]
MAVHLKQLRHFITLFEQGNFARAAEKLGITQSALTQSIARLEADLGVRLFDRGRFGAVITDAGSLLLPRAKLISAEVNLAESEMHETRGVSRPRVSIGVGKSLAHDIVPMAMRNALAKDPDMHITAIEGWSSELFAKLLAGELDFVVSTPLPGIEPDLDLRQIFLYEQREAATIGSAHPLAQRDTVALSDLVDALWLIPPSGWGRSHSLQRRFQDAGHPPPHRFLRSDSSAVGISLLRMGVVVCLGIVDVTTEAMEPHEYRILDIPELTFGRPVQMTLRKRGRLQSAANLLCDEIHLLCREMP